MLPFGVTIPATVPQKSEIPVGLTNYPVKSALVNTAVKLRVAYKAGNFMTTEGTTVVQEGV
jgi:hypothetical protein